MRVYSFGPRGPIQSLQQRGQHERGQQKPNAALVCTSGVLILMGHAMTPYRHGRGSNIRAAYVPKPARGKRNDGLPVK